jgi:hypothetical protein
MRLSTRETLLGWLTLTVLLCGATYFMGRSKLEEWKKIDESRERLAMEIDRNERLVGKRDYWVKEFERNIAVLRSYPEGQKVESTILKEVTQLAQKNKLRLVQLKPGDESILGDIHELEIKCNDWTGELDACVKFLYDLQVQGANYKMRSITAKPTKDGSLKGTFTLDCAYTRVKAQPEPESTLEVTPVAATP